MRSGACGGQKSAPRLATIANRRPRDYRLKPYSSRLPSVFILLFVPYTGIPYEVWMYTSQGSITRTQTLIAPQEVFEKRRPSHTSDITHTHTTSTSSRCSTSVSASVTRQKAVQMQPIHSPQLRQALLQELRAVLQVPLHSRFSGPLPLLLHSRLHASSVESHSVSH